jgi:hypothetical protein
VSRATWAPLRHLEFVAGCFVTRMYLQTTRMYLDVLLHEYAPFPKPPEMHERGTMGGHDHARPDLRHDLRWMWVSAEALLIVEFRSAGSWSEVSQHQRMDRRRSPRLAPPNLPTKWRCRGSSGRWYHNRKRLRRCCATLSRFILDKGQLEMI